MSTKEFVAIITGRSRPDPVAGKAPGSFSPRTKRRQALPRFRPLFSASNTTPMNPGIGEADGPLAVPATGRTQSRNEIPPSTPPGLSTDNAPGQPTHGVPGASENPGGSNISYYDGPMANGHGAAGTAGVSGTSPKARSQWEPLPNGGDALSVETEPGKWETRGYLMPTSPDQKQHYWQFDFSSGLFRNDYNFDPKTRKWEYQNPPATSSSFPSATSGKPTGPGNKGTPSPQEKSLADKAKGAVDRARTIPGTRGNLKLTPSVNKRGIRLDGEFRY